MRKESNDAGAFRCSLMSLLQDTLTEFTFLRRKRDSADGLITAAVEGRSPDTVLGLSLVVG